MADQDFKFDQKGLATVRPGAKTLTLSDPKTPGLVLRVTPTGSKVYYLTYRMGGRGTKKQWLKLGTFAELPLNRIQEKARACRAQVDAGEDPAAILKAKNIAGTTVAKLAEQFKKDYLPRLAAKTQEDYRGSIKVHILPTLGEIPVADISRTQIQAWHQKIAKPRAANLALAVLSSMMTQAMLWGFRPEGLNPCSYVTRNPENPRARDIQVKELEAIGMALRQLAGEHSPWALGAIKVAALCWGRISEILSLRRDRDVFLDDGYAVIRDHKTSRKKGSKDMTLIPEVVEILKTIPEVKGNPYYFCGSLSPDAPLSRHSLHHTWLAVCKKARVKNLHIHDFRSLAASEGEAQGIPLKTMAHLLGHSDTRTVVQHYTNVRRGGATEAAKKIAAPIVKALEGETTSKAEKKD